MAPHQQYHLSGRLHVVMQDGSEIEAGPGDVTSLPPATMRGWSATIPLLPLIGRALRCGRDRATVSRP
jgi:hypothetical protein